MAGKKVKVFLSILIMLTFSALVFTWPDVSLVQLSPQAGIEKWQRINENAKIAALAATGSFLIVVLMAELILLRKIEKKHATNSITNQVKINSF